MKYKVTAQPRPEELRRFWTLLNDGTIERQEPDGREIVSSMKRATITGDRVRWSETCYCNPPLQHERATIYDEFFTDMQIEPLGTETLREGQRFWDYLREMSSQEDGEVTVSAATPVRYIPIRIL